MSRGAVSTNFRVYPTVLWKKMQTLREGGKAQGLVPFWVAVAKASS